MVDESLAPITKTGDASAVKKGAGKGNVGQSKSSREQAEGASEAEVGKEMAPKGEAGDASADKEDAERIKAESKMASEITAGNLSSEISGLVSLFARLSLTCFSFVSCSLGFMASLEKN